MEDIKLNLGNKIKMLREIKGFSQEAIALEIGLSQQAFQKIESGASKISIERANKIAKSLELDLESLLNFQPSNYLNNCTQSGIINTNHLSSEGVIEKYEKQVNFLRKEIEFLREQNIELLKMMNEKR
jgi:transcriptional regulator with XRE-family HTH domain